MEKPAFLRLPEEKRRRITDRGKEIYTQYDYDEITIRFLTEKLGMDMATFYRYFENKDDLLLYAYKEMLSGRNFRADSSVVLFVGDYKNERDRKFAAACRAMFDKPVRNKLIDVELDVTYPIFRQKLQAEKYKGTLRDDVDTDLIAYLYAAVGRELFDYFALHQITDIDLQEKMKDYIFHSFFLHGIKKNS